jgi:hypothetical protein
MADARSELLNNGKVGNPASPAGEGSLYVGLAVPEHPEGSHGLNLGREFLRFQHIDLLTQRHDFESPGYFGSEGKH